MTLEWSVLTLCLACLVREAQLLTSAISMKTLIVDDEAQIRSGSDSTAADVRVAVERKDGMGTLAIQVDGTTPVPLVAQQSMVNVFI